MKLRPDGIHTTPEAQAASLVIAKEGVAWVVYGTAEPYELYSCRQKTFRNDQEANAPTPTPAETKPAAATPAPVAAAATQTPETKMTNSRSEDERPQGADHEQPGSSQGVQVPGKLCRFRERAPLSGGRRQGGRKRRLRRGHQAEWRRHRRVLLVLGDGSAMKARRVGRPNAQPARERVCAARRGPVAETEEPGRAALRLPAGASSTSFRASRERLTNASIPPAIMT